MLIEQFEKNLFGCRFCPMCKPYGEVGEIKKDEPHSTRVRGLLLWKILKGYDNYNEDVARIIYDSTLDTVSQAWCVNHYPVAEIVLSARADIYDAGLAPDAVKNYSPSLSENFSRALSQFVNHDASTVLYPEMRCLSTIWRVQRRWLNLSTNMTQNLPSRIFTMIAVLWHIVLVTVSLPKGRHKKSPIHFPTLRKSLWTDRSHIGHLQAYIRRWA